MIYAAVGVLVSLIFVGVKKSRKRGRWKVPKEAFPVSWRVLLMQEVAFYNSLSDIEKSLFEYKVHEFILNYRITGITVDVAPIDRIYVAASAVIPIFQFPTWRYTNLFEVLLYPDMFNEEFATTGPGRNILGMVGTGYMSGKMILSKPALHHGFDNTSDKKNTAVHEFVHLIDMQDGVIDGIPSLLLEQPYILPWLDLINSKIDQIYKEKSDINPYGGTNRIEFFAVASEYFFERPKLLAKKHPKLYDILEEIFDQDMDTRNLNIEKMVIGRNSPCPCGNGRKFKVCCGAAGVDFF